MPKYLDYNGFIHYNEGLNKKFLGKVDKIAGKNLSTNDYTNSEKEKLKGIASNAQVNTIENISIDGVKLQISNKNINIPLATKTQLGLVKIGDNLNIDNGVLSVSRNITGDTLPIGSTVEWWCEEAPENWLICNGQAVSRTDYKDLFNVIGTQYGAGDGNTTFNLPNLSGRVPVGLTTTEGDNYKLLGNKGGSKTHLLTIEEMPSHTHNGGTSDAKTSFMRAVSTAGDFYARNHTVSNGSGSYSDYSGGSSDFPGASHYHTFTTSSVGKDKAFDIMPSYIVSHFIIKAKQGAPIIATVKDNLTSESTSDALSANQGRILNEKIEGVMLYENTAGSDGNITLNRYLYNFKRLKVEYCVEHGGKQKFVKEFFNPSGQIATLGFVIKDATQDVLFVGGKTVELADNHIRNLVVGRATQASMEFNTFQQWTVSQISIMITRVIAYYDY